MRYILLLFFACISQFLLAQEIKHSHNIHYAFIENKGQWHSEVLFKAKIATGNMWIQQHKFVFHIQNYAETKMTHLGNDKARKFENKQQVVHFNFVGSNKITKIERFGKTKSYYNYFLGNDSSKWASGVHGYSEALLYDLYDHIHLKLIEEGEQLKYEFHVKPNTDPHKIKIDVVGQDKMFIDKHGNLNIETKAGNFQELNPIAYQIKNGKIIDVACEFSLNNNQLSFQLGNYDKTVELIIDPTLIFATYSGSITDNFGMTATYGYNGKAFSGGTIYGNSYPTPDNAAFDITSNFTIPQNPYYGITDVFISNYSADGTTMNWTSFLGGGDTLDGTETVHSLICDANNNVYLFGATSSNDFPIVNGFQTTHAGGTANSNFYYNGVYYKSNGTDIYVAKLSADGHQLLGSTYMGGTDNDGINYKTTSGNYSSFASYDSLTNNYGDQFRGEVMLDENGNCLVASCTRSTDFPILNAVQPSLGGKQDGIVFKLSPDLSTLIWSSYYGGSNNDACYSVKIDSSYNVVVGGGTSSSDLIGTTGGWQSSYNGGKTDGFVFKLTPNGQTLTQATYVGTSNLDQVFFIEIDRNDKIFVLGQSAGGAFPVVNAAYSNPGSSQFIAKLDENLTTVENATVFGNGSPQINISPSAFLVDICGNMYVSGWGANILQASPISGMPITSDAFQSSPPNGFDFYLFVLRRGFSDILYGSYIGGNQANEHVDGGTSRFDKNGIVYQSVCGGCGGFSDFPTTSGAHSQSNLSSNCNNLLFKFDFNLIPNAEFTVDQNIGCAEFEVTFDNFSSDSDSYLWDFGNGDTSTVVFNPTLVYDTPGTYQINLYVTDSVCLLTDSAQITITVTDSIELSVSPDQILCVPVQTTFTATTNGTATDFIWSDEPTFTNVLGTDSILTITPNSEITYYVQASNSGCSKVDSVHVSFIGSSIHINGNDTLCLGESTSLTVVNENPSVNFTYTWSPANIITNGQNTNQVQANPDSSQYIVVVATAANGCVAEDSIWIAVGSIPDSLIEASANPNVVPIGGETQLHVEPSAYSYLWLPEQLVDQPTSQTTHATVDESTNFVVLISDGVCQKMDTVWVEAFPFVCDDPFVFVPNAFSPNGDGENDVLYVYGDMIQGILFRIYDRWGELVFETTSRSEGWDGTFRGKQLDPDVYDYYLQVDCIGGLENIIKGNITLIK